ncbi:MAG: hypothetical protein Hens3KO_25020 [Henriciella sp.]
MQSDLKILDCTLRDGGYYNAWDFDRGLVDLYLQQLARGGVDIIELGFRFTDTSKFYGPYAHTSEAFLETLDLPEGPLYGVMLNASDYLTDHWQDDIKRRFVPAVESKISLVRIAAHIHQVLDCGPLVAELKQLGYQVGLNIMQISQASEEKTREIIKRIESEFVDFEALYFADSLGNLRPEDITRIVTIFKDHTTKAVGFHGHDNINLGVANSMTSIEAGATWVDATITGMGRGAGNTQTEYLATELKHRKLADLKCIHIHQVATGEFSEMQKHYGWGTNLFYYEAGLRAVHPTYVQQMLSSKRFEAIDILSMIETLGDSSMNLSYSDQNIETAFTQFLSNANGKDDISGRWAGRDIILVAGGPNARKHWAGIKEFAAKSQAVVVAVNIIDFAEADSFDAVICVHPARMLALLRSQAWDSVPLVSSGQAIPSEVEAGLVSGRQMIDYGVQVKSGQFETFGNGCCVPAPLAAGVALAASHDAGARRIWLAGFDGFDGKSRDFTEMQDLLNLAHTFGLDIKSLTKTHFNLEMGSLYGILEMT